MNRWIKVNGVDEIITMGDEVNYDAPGYCDRLEKFQLDYGQLPPPVDEGWEGYTYEQGKGLFCWRNGAKEFVSYEWAIGDFMLEEAKYNGAIAAKKARIESEDSIVLAAAAKDIQAAAKLESDIKALKKNAGLPE